MIFRRPVKQQCPRVSAVRVQARVKVGHAQDAGDPLKAEEAAKDHQGMGNVLHHWKNLLDSTNRAGRRCQEVDQCVQDGDIEKPLQLR